MVSQADDHYRNNRKIKSVRIVRMKKLVWTFLAIFFLLSACQSKTILVVLLADGHIYSLKTIQYIPAGMLETAGVSLGPNDRLFYLGSAIPIDNPLPEAKSYTLSVRRAVDITLDESINPQTVIHTSAVTVGEALTEAGVTLYSGDFLNLPTETPITGPMTVTYRPGREITILVDGTRVQFRSSAATVGQVLAEAGIPLVGVDTCQPGESSPVPPDGQIRVVRVIEW